MKVSFCLFTYNQLSFIEEAIESALAQDYSPLQIIIIDDGSDDGTQDAIRRMLSKYSGEHEITLLLKESNLGLSDSVNSAIYDLSDGEWLVFAAGDDCFSKNRVSMVVNHATSDPTVTIIESAVVRINSSGEILNNIKPTRLCLMDTVDRSALGAAAAYKKAAVSNFPKISSKVVREDVVLTTRALLSGKFACIDDHLVKWRRHSGNLSGRYGGSRLEKIVFTNGRFNDDSTLSLIQQISDVTHSMNHGGIDVKDGTDLVLRFSDRIKKNRARAEFYNAAGEGIFKLHNYLRSKPVNGALGIIHLLCAYIKQTLSDLRWWMLRKLEETRISRRGRG